MEALQPIIEWLKANWQWVAVLLLWLVKSWKDGKLEEQLRLALAGLVDLAKQYAGEIPKEAVLAFAYKVYDAEELLDIPDWLNWAIDALKLAILGTREAFGEKVWQAWQDFLNAQATAKAAGLV
jgi:hypothetical protein